MRCMQTPADRFSAQRPGRLCKAKPTAPSSRPPGYHERKEGVSQQTKKDGGPLSHQVASAGLELRGVGLRDGDTDERREGKDLHHDV